MNAKEQKRVMVLNRIVAGQLSLAEAGILVELSGRQDQLILVAFRKECLAAVAHENRGRKPVHHIQTDKFTKHLRGHNHWTTTSRVYALAVPTGINYAGSTWDAIISLLGSNTQIRVATVDIPDTKKRYSYRSVMVSTTGDLEVMNPKPAIRYSDEVLPRF